MRKLILMIIIVTIIGKHNYCFSDEGQMSDAQISPFTYNQIYKKAQELKEFVDFNNLYLFLSKHIQEKYLVSPKELAEYCDVEPGKGHYFLNIRYEKGKVTVFIHEILGNSFKVWINSTTKENIPINDYYKYYKVDELEGNNAGGSFRIFQIDNGIGYSWSNTLHSMDLLALWRDTEFVKRYVEAERYWKRVENSLSSEKIHKFLSSYISQEYLPSLQELKSSIKVQKTHYSNQELYGNIYAKGSLQTTQSFLEKNFLNFSICYKVKGKNIDIYFTNIYNDIDIFSVKIFPFEFYLEERDVTDQELLGYLTTYFHNLPKLSLNNVTKSHSGKFTIKWEKGNMRFEFYPFENSINYSVRFPKGEFGKHLEKFGEEVIFKN